MYNKLLQRQIQKYLGTDVQNFKSCTAKQLDDFLKVISESYDHYEKDRSMLERSIELSSSEMIELNNRLREESTESLKKTNEDLLKTNHELDKFVYSVSHDLRAPLSSMLGIVVIAEEESKETFVLEHLSMLKESIKKLDGFIADILDYSRNARLEVKKEEINFNEILRDVTQNLKYMGGIRKVAINLDIKEAAPFHSDKNRLSVILNNLVSNSIRYQNPNVDDPFVNIKVDTSDTETNIIVKDNGIGIGKELHEKIFDMFYRVSQDSIGSGLGLYIVKETICKLNGHINVESEIGKGSTFNIVIPNN